MLVMGIDVALVNTGVAVIEDGVSTWRATIKVVGHTEDTGPRYAALRKSLEKLLTRVRRTPTIVAVEQPEHALRRHKLKGRNVRVSVDPGAIMKLYGAFAVAYAECRRLWPRADVMGVLPARWKGNFGKDITWRMMAAKYKVECANEHEADALGLADFAWDTLMLRRNA